MLEGLGYREKDVEGRYSIIDPVLREFLKKLFGTNKSKRVDLAH
jgi:hypothetical protein